MAAASASTAVECLFHEGTNTCTFIVSDPSTKAAIIIDPVMDFNPANGRTSNEHNEAVVAKVAELGVDVKYIAETHVHADHLTGAAFLKAKYPSAKTMIGRHVIDVQTLFKGIFNIADLKDDGSAFDILADDEQELPLGDLTIRVMHTPGHTPACVTYVIGDACFTGDTIFMPDFGSARCDFPKGSATDLYKSVTSKIFSLPDETRVFVGHDYAPGGRDIKWETTVGEEKAANKHLKAGTGEESFVEMRSTRDSTLSAPRLLLPSLQVNLRNGQLPPAESNGTSYLKIPLNTV